MFQKKKQYRIVLFLFFRKFISIIVKIIHIVYVKITSQKKLVIRRRRNMMKKRILKLCLLNLSAAMIFATGVTAFAANRDI